MIDYDEYEILGEEPIFQSLDEVKKACKNATIEELIAYHEACIAEHLYEYARYINRIIKNEQVR